MGPWYPAPMAAALESAVAPDIPLPPELPAEHIDKYIAAARELVAKGRDAAEIAREYSSTVRQYREAGIDPFDPALDEVVFEGPVEEAIAWLDRESSG